MNQVSRSFALVVPFLETPLNHWIATAYLICRVVDNIEDCTRSVEWKAERFEELHELLAHPEKAHRVLSGWEQASWDGLTESETAMMGVAGGLPLWQIYSQIPDSARQGIGRWAGEMARGMLSVQDPNDEPHFVEHNGVLMLQREQDYDRYCYYVAGTVGRMSTELVVDHYGLEEDTSSLLFKDCEACGRALQKTNIVKDFAEDLARGVSFLPDEWLQRSGYSPLQLTGASPDWKMMVLDNVLKELRESVHYLMALPFRAKGYRMASLMCLLPAYQTLLLAAKQQHILFTEQHHVKISKLTMAQCAKDAHRMLYDNEAIDRYSRSIESEIGAKLSVSAMQV
ncbi:MAG: squalene/phytoene synthase family protein [Caldilineaceae bacterium]|nr:squalene/phytoene synthase family protein [Caldilineaceae bacterium]